MKFQIVHSLLAATLGLGMASSLASQGINLPPSDLSPGEQYRVMFVSDSERDATSTDIADYNAFVAADAHAVSEMVALNTNWRAVASTAAVSARANTMTDPTPAGSTGVPIYRPDGVRIADDYDHLWGTVTTALHASCLISPSGLLLDKHMWTGTQSIGIPRASYEMGAVGFVVVGDSGHTSSGWAIGGVSPPSLLKHIYGMSDVLTVPPPEPFEDYGSACGFPVMASGSTELGSQYTLRSGVIMSPGIAVMLLGATQQSLDLTGLGLPLALPGCQLLTSAEVVVPMQLVSVRPPPFSISHFELTLPVATEPSVVGVSLYHQGALVDSASRIALSQGIAVTYFDSP
ncbi:MAG: hypothetical protein AAF628_10360 [Planctomycetota bacterium]